MITATREPTFLYPNSRQFPFDEVCEQIVRALDERSWDVSGMTVEFDVYGSGDAKYRMVRYIMGDDFKLWFCRLQANMGRWNDTAAVTTIIIPRREIQVHDDESGPTFYAYVGNDWETDKDRFMNGSKVNSKLHNEPRTYLKYKGGCECGAEIMGSRNVSHTHPGRRSPLLVHDNDLGREYDPKAGEHYGYITEVVLDEFTQWLEENVLARILETPETDPNDYCPPESFFARRPNPWTPVLAEIIGPLFVYGENRDAHRVVKGRSDASQLASDDRYGMPVRGYRLVPLSAGDGNVPEVAYDGFLWCGLGEVTTATSPAENGIAGHHLGSSEGYVFRLLPNRTDGVYIADHDRYVQRRKELGDAIDRSGSRRSEFSGAEVADFVSARARTILPIAEYAALVKADPSLAFIQPVVLINRELDLDEVELVSGPWPEYQYVMLINGYSPEAHALLEAVLASREAYYNRYDMTDRVAIETAHNEAIARLDGYTVSDLELFSQLEACSWQLFSTKRHSHSNVISHLVDAAYGMRYLGLI